MELNGEPGMPEADCLYASPGAEGGAAAAEPSATLPASQEGLEEAAGDDGAQPGAPHAAGEAPSAEEAKRWPGWPGANVFRVIVPVAKVGGIIGRRGELIKKLCEETRARVRILEGAVGTSDRIVLISGREEPEAAVSPAMNAVIRIFKRINGISESADGTLAAPAGSTVCSVRLLMAYSQAINLIGKGGTVIRSIQDGSGATILVLSADEVPFYATSDERIVEIQGDHLKVLEALEGVVGHLRKFLVDHSVIPLFEKTSQYNPAVSSTAQDWVEKTPSLMQKSQTRISGDYPSQLKRDSLFFDREPQVDSQIQRSGVSLYGQDPVVSGLRSSEFGYPITQITHTMQVPLSCADDIIGIAGKNIAYIRRTSGAAITLKEPGGLSDDMAVEMKGTMEQVQTAQELIHEFTSGHRGPAATSYTDGYGIDTSVRPSYSNLPEPTYPPPASSQSYGGYGASGYDRYRF
ncbi:hypothetical protein Taro_019904 [Colocasia esculenta]|uniref:K Homology domain-containing protein n=1 Tax=Colocasia esculenta TaxID=4460 RepID=A0A843V0S3_COLES|nr:hypothetical protein [Colocasia esculenta]